MGKGASQFGAFPILLSWSLRLQTLLFVLVSLCLPQLNSRGPRFLLTWTQTLRWKGIFLKRLRQIAKVLQWNLILSPTLIEQISQRKSPQLRPIKP